MRSATERPLGLAHPRIQDACGVSGKKCRADAVSVRACPLRLDDAGDAIAVLLWWFGLSLPRVGSVRRDGVTINATCLRCSQLAQ